MAHDSWETGGCLRGPHSVWNGDAEGLLCPAAATQLETIGAKHQLLATTSGQ